MNKHNGRTRLTHTIMIAALLIGISLASSTLAYLVRGTGAVTNVFAAAPAYTLTYHENDGATPTAVTDMPNPKAGIKSYTGTFTISEDVPKRAGYRFIGWDTRADGKGTRLAASTAAKPVTYAIPDTSTQDHVNLYAIWEMDKYKLKYDPNGGAIGGVTGQLYEDESDDAAASHTFTIKSNEELQLTHSDPNKVFMGWAERITSDDPNPTHGYQGKGKVADDEGIVSDVSNLESTITLQSPVKTKTIYALWATKYSLHFDENAKYEGVGPVPDTMTVVKCGKTHRFYLPDESVGPIPSRVAYNFQYWGFTEDRISGEKHVSFGEYVDVSDTEPEKTLYARYLPREAAILHFDANVPDGVTFTNIPGKIGASLNVESPNYPIWSFNLPDNIPTADGRTFLGWSRSKDATEPEYNANSLFAMNIDINREETLYAIWFPPHKYSITLHANADDARLGTIMYPYEWSGSTCTDAPDKSTSLILSKDMAVSEKQSQVMRGNYLYAGATRPGYRHAGYALTPNADEDDIAYTLGDYSKIVEPIQLTCEDENCPGNTVHNLDLYAVWVPQHSIQIKFYTNNEKVSAYYFNIVPNSAGGGKYGTRDYTDNSETAIFSTQDAVNKTFTVPTNGFQRVYCQNVAGYRFLGWSTDPNATAPDAEYALTTGNEPKFVNPMTFTVEESDCEAGAVHEVLKLYAVWEPLHRFGIKFIWNNTGTTGAQYDTWNFGFGGGDMGVRDRTYFTPTIPASQKTYTVPAGTAGGMIKNSTGDQFIGWASSPENAAAGIVDPAFELDENGKFKHDIVFTDPDNDCEGGWAPTGSDTNANVVSHTVKTLYGIWKSKHAFQLKLYQNGGGVVYSSGIPGGEYNGETNRTAYYDNTQSSMTIEAGTFWAYATSRTGYKFLGWSESPNATTPDPAYAIDANNYFINDITLNDPNGDSCPGGGAVHTSLTLYAVWEPLHAFGFRYNVKKDRNLWSITATNFEGEGTYTYKQHEYVTRTAFVPKSDTERVIPAGTWKANITYVKDYLFIGWASSAEDAAAGRVDPAYELDSNGCFKNEIKITHDDSTCTTGNVVHYIELYPVLKPAHLLGIRVEMGDADYTYESGNSRTYPFVVKSAQLFDDVFSYTWQGGTVSIGAKKAGYKLIGWSTDPNASDPMFTMTDNGRIVEDVSASITEHDSCSAGAVHEAITIYPVFEKEYILNYDANDGTNAPEKQTYADRKDDTGNFADSHVFDIYDDVTNNNPPKRDRFRFMGWSTTKNSGALGQYGYRNDENGNNPELGRVTNNLQNSITLSADQNVVTLYAVWWREYIFRFDANGGTNAPENSFKYTSALNDTIDVPSEIPERTDESTGEAYTFLGWSEDPNATEPTYVVGDKINLQCGKDGHAEIQLYAVWQEP